MTFKILLFLGLVALALATPARVKNDQCPLRTLKDKAACRDQHSECWSPGKGDTDCPNNGLCCFDGCVNKCKIPNDELEVFEKPPKCQIEYEQKMELVKMDHCVDVPDLQTCIESQKLKCRQECAMFEEPHTITNEEKCCKIEQNMVCEDAPCDANELYEVERSVGQEICLNQQGFCWKRPDQQCFDIQVPDCRMATRTECKKIPSQRCEVVKKPIETQVPDEKCSTQYKEVCENKVKQWCPDTREGRAGVGCQDMTYKDCKKVPYEHCQHFTRTVVTYVEENVCIPIEETKCHPVTEQTCTTKIEKQCKAIEKEECLAPSQTCNKKEFPEKQLVKKNCQIKDQVCRLEPKESCKLNQIQAVIKKPVRKCHDVCESYTVNECDPEKTRKECKSITKEMYFTVPVEKCEKLIDDDDDEDEDDEEDTDDE